MNRFTHLMELTSKKKEDSIESRIVLDGTLRDIKKYLKEQNVIDFKDNSKDSKSTVMKYDKKFFKDNLPLQNVLAISKDGSVSVVNPFKLIKFEPNMEGSIVNPNKIKDGIYKGQIGFEDVLIKDRITKLSYADIGHEIVHTQIEKNPNSLTNYYNREVLSIFVEMIISKSLSKKIINDYMKYRFQDVYTCLEGLSKYEQLCYTYDQMCRYRCYLSSSLKALHLYDIYINSNEIRRMEILSLIEDVFRNKITVEDFLNNMGVTYNNSKDIELIKEYVKKTK